MLSDSLGSWPFLWTWDLCIKILCLILPLALASESFSHSFSLPFPGPLTLTMCFLLSALPCIGFPGGTVVKNSPASAGIIRDVGLIPESGKPPEEGNDKPLQYSCLENSIDKGAWWATVHGITKIRTQVRDRTTKLLFLHFPPLLWGFQTSEAL